MRRTFASSTIPLRIFLHCCIIILSTWAREGFASTDNLVQLKNRLFMHRPTFIEKLYQNNVVKTASGNYTRKQIENGAIPIDIIKATHYSPQEIYRLIGEAIEDQEDILGKLLKPEEKKAIKKEFFQKYANTVDTQVIQGVALALAQQSPQSILDLFLRLDRFTTYAPGVFLEATHLTKEDLASRGVVKLSNLEFQYSKVRIAHVEFSHTLRYEISSETKPYQARGTQELNPVELKTFTVAWEIEPEFRKDADYSQQGVLMNNGQFIIEPYVDDKGVVDLNRSLIMYHIYIKVSPLNAILETLKPFFIDSEAKNAIHTLAEALTSHTGETK